ncbi:hypothetical protein ACFSSC_02295 [Corynebacterium mendelii]|uniref:Uncharacterized protein n=1 Tax=Corynebacterium mendelii TaxID=2765362 RepID=A0A939DZX0_9CORY|nr:hypothetical protein [Corynebacterium mendelii]MBN9644113.1 hypothetical protein [Corynebacterium mendelii]
MTDNHLPPPPAGGGENTQTPTVMAIDTARAEQLIARLRRESLSLAAPPHTLPAPTVGWEDFRRALSEAIAAHSLLRDRLSAECDRQAQAMDTAVASARELDSDLARTLEQML